jgi:hypothetical protein
VQQQHLPRPIVIRPFFSPTHRERARRRFP